MPTSHLAAVREQLSVYGDAELDDAELLALLLPAARESSSRELAHRVLATAGGTRGLSTATPAELARIDGVGTAAASRICAALALARRALRRGEPGRALRSAGDVAARLAPRLSHLDVEVFVVLGVDARNHVVLETEIARGHLTGVDVHPREVFRPLVRAGVHAAVLAHNHPSGSAEPSAEDLALTLRLRDAGELVGIAVLDHVVIACEQHTSLAEWGYL